MSDVINLERDIANIKQLVEARDRAERLYRNPDFRKLILEQYLVEDAARFVQQSQDPCLGKAEREDALNMAVATGHLKRYLQMQVTMGNNAENALKDLEEELTQARLEEDLAKNEGDEVSGDLA